MAAKPGRPDGALRRPPPPLRAPPPASPPHLLRGRDGHRQAPSGAGCGTTTPPATPAPPTPRPWRRGWRWPTRCTPSSPWSPTSDGPPCRSRGRSMPQPGGPTSSAASTGASPGSCARGRPGSSPPRRVMGARPPPAHTNPHPPCRLPKAGRHLPLRGPLHHRARPPLASDRRRPRDHGAASPGSRG